MNQLSIDFAQSRRDTGMARAERSAGKAWQDRAVNFCKEYVVTHRGDFLAEDLREWAESHGLPKPENEKSWGPAMIAAARQGIIRSTGWAPARSSNLSAKRTWAAV